MKCNLCIQNCRECLLPASGARCQTAKNPAGGILQNDNNILTRPLADILTDSCYSRVFDMPLSEVAENNPECAECSYLDACRGGCRAYAYGTSMAFHEGYQAGKGRLNYHAETNCAYYKGGYSEQFQM